MRDLKPQDPTAASSRQLLAGILATLAAIVVAATIVIVLLPRPHMAESPPPGPDPSQRIAPVARVEIAAAAPAAAPSAEPAATPVPAPAPVPTPAPTATREPAVPAISAAASKPAAAPPTPAETKPVAAAGKTGEQVYHATCWVCHATGVAEAPKLGDKAAWAPRIAGGLPALAKNAMSGKGNMPARGGNMSLSDQEVVRAIIYMANQSGAAFKEPAATAAAPAAVATAPAAPTAKLTEKPAEKPTEKAAAKPAEKRAAAAPSEPAAVVGKAEPAAPRVDGKAVYQNTCSACHAAGNAGAPKIGDIAAWGPRIATGAEAMMNSVLHGKGAMPPKGGNAKLSEAEVRAGLEYMLGQFR